MDKKTWEIQFLSPPPVLKYCRKCGKKAEFTCAGRFRINAQGKYLDIWLIYKCSNCDATWNAPVFSRISPQSISANTLDGFYQNDTSLVDQYAMNRAFLRGNGVEAGLPEYLVIGDGFPLENTTELEIKTQYSLPIKVSLIIRDKLRLSQKEYSQLIADGKIESIPGQNLEKCRLNSGIALVFHGRP